MIDEKLLASAAFTAALAHVSQVHPSTRDDGTRQKFAVVSGE